MKTRNPSPPFQVVRHGPKGPDSHLHTFCVVAIGNREAVRLGIGRESAAINGASGSDPKATRASVQRLCDALNEQFDRYMAGEFHSQQPEENPT